jgi:hypothetical protein
MEILWGGALDCGADPSINGKYMHVGQHIYIHIH